MVQYGFDGFDIDCEYPGAPDRGGTLADVKNFPLLLQIIQAKFAIESKPFEISATTPTSYWYLLRWFDLQNSLGTFDFVYDPDAAVNYLSYGDNGCRAPLSPNRLVLSWLRPMFNICRDFV